jgi:hypothetical protein
MISEGGSGGTFFYVPDLVLRETTGEGAATITEIVFATTSAGSASPVPTTAGCLRSHIVPAGKTWRLLDPANSDYYCQEIDTNGELKALVVTVRYVDPQGRLGVATGSTGQ